MTAQENREKPPVVIDRQGLDLLVKSLNEKGYQVIGPRVEDAAVVLGPVAGAADLPAGWREEQDGGHYRLVDETDDSLFAYGPGPHSWKRYLFPARERLWRARRDGSGFVIEDGAEKSPRYAFLGVRSCDLSAIAIQDRVFDNGDFSEPGYGRRRANGFIVAVECTRAGGTCLNTLYSR